MLVRKAHNSGRNHLANVRDYYACQALCHLLTHSLTSCFSTRARQGSKHHRPDHSGLRDWRWSTSRRLWFWSSAPRRTTCFRSAARWLWWPSWPVPCVLFSLFLTCSENLLHSSSTISSWRHAPSRSHGSATWWSSSLPSRLHASPWLVPWWYVLRRHLPIVLLLIGRHSGAPPFPPNGLPAPASGNVPPFPLAGNFPPGGGPAQAAPPGANGGTPSNPGPGGMHPDRMRMMNGGR